MKHLLLHYFSTLLLEEIEMFVAILFHEMGRQQRSKVCFQHLFKNKEHTDKASKLPTSAKHFCA